MRDPFVEFDPKLVREVLPPAPRNVFLTFSVFFTGVLIGAVATGAFLI